MHILITGAAGMIGSKLAASLASDPPPGLTRMTLVDVVAPRAPAGSPVATVAAALDIADAGGGGGAGGQAAGGDLPPCGGGVGRGGGGLRQGLRGELRRHPGAVRGDPGAAGLQAEGDLRLVDRGVRGAVPRDDPRGVSPDAADELRRAEGDGGADARRLHAARLHGRGRAAAADDLRAAGAAEQGGVGLLLQHPARAAGRAGGGAAGRRGRAALVREPPRRGRLLSPCAGDGSRA